MPLTYASLTPSDAAAVRMLGLATPELHVHAGAPAYYPEAHLQNLFTSPTDIYLGAKNGDTLAGYFLATYNPYLQEAYLIDMVVQPEYRGQGVATKLFQMAFKLLHERNCAWAWGLVHEDNLAMMNIMDQKGFSRGRTFVLYSTEL